MSKYDFGYEIAPKSTIEWAYEQIEQNTTVLELGPATGNLAFHLSGEKKCIVDIVEIDVESGEQASKYARISCLGDVEGNLEKEEWFNKLNGNQYDYIVILDVLEHIRNPREVLERLSTLLKEDGCILLSIPNIAHNSIILDLLRDQFNYTDVGILDDTHVRFYTYGSIKKLLNGCGLVTIREQVKQEKVGQNEIEASYGALPRSLEAYLKTKETGTAYQYLFTINKGTEQEDIKVEYDRTYDRMYEVVIFDADSNDILAIQSINPKESNKIEVNFPKETKRLRIDPLNVNCIISNAKIYASINGEHFNEIDMKEFTGIRYENKFVFFDDDPQIYVEVPNGTKKLLFTCEYLFFDNESISALNNFRDVYRQSQSDLSEMQEVLKQKDNTLDGLWKRISELEGHLKKCQEQLREQQEQLREQQEQLREQQEQLREQQEQLRLKQEELVEYQVRSGRQEEKLNMYNIQRQQQEAQLLECRTFIKEQNIQLNKMSDALKISNENLQECESHRIRKEVELEDYKYTLREREKVIDSLNSELWDIQKSMWGRIYYKLKSYKQK